MKLAASHHIIRSLALWVWMTSTFDHARATSHSGTGWRLPHLLARSRQSPQQMHSVFLNTPTQNNKIPLVLDLRGGSTATAAPPSTPTTTTSKDDEEAKALRAYRWQQQLYLQSRSMQLRQALLARGLDGLHHSPEALETAQKHKPVDWDCALATTSHPKSCLYSYDAEPGTKVVAPRDTTQWISLQALNRLRRSDPTKVEPLWHSQYSILGTWLNAADPTYSMYPYLSPTASVVSFLLDSPVVLVGGLVLAAVTVFLVTLPFWESLVTTLLTSSLLWMQWPNWGRFIHAALPLKLLLGQMAWKGIALAVSKAYHTLRQRLVEWECQLWEECLPLTILEGKMKEAAEAAAAAAAAGETVDLEADIEEEDDFDNEEDMDEMDFGPEEDEYDEDLGDFSEEDE